MLTIVREDFNNNEKLIYLLKFYKKKKKTSEKSQIALHTNEKKIQRFSNKIGIALLWYAKKSNVCKILHSSIH